MKALFASLKQGSMKGKKSNKIVNFLFPEEV
jgi:hypothetical protein